jgi:hypothetical protein
MPPRPVRKTANFDDFRSSTLNTQSKIWKHHRKVTIILSVALIALGALLNRKTHSIQVRLAGKVFMVIGSSLLLDKLFQKNPYRKPSPSLIKTNNVCHIL